MEERIRLSQSFINNKNDPNLYPNDEIFVATILHKMNYFIKNMSPFTYFHFKLFTSDEDEAMTIEDAANIKGDLIIHPVLEKKIFLNKKMFRFNTKLENNETISDWIKSILFKIKNENFKKELISEFQRNFDNFIKRL